jgi:hypothetical protein
MRYLNVDQIAEHLKISVKSVRNKICKTGLKKSKTVKGRSLYAIGDLHLLGNDLNKYYPIKTTIIYHIYESKINFDNTM